jgi:hypothetical protein
MNQIYLSIPLVVHDENGIEESPALLLALDTNWINARLAYCKRTELLKAGDRDVFEVTRHNFGLQIYDRSRIDLDGLDLYQDGESTVELTRAQYEHILGRYENEGTTLASDDPGIYVKAECMLEHNMDDGVYFTAVLKYTSITLESQGLGVDTLERYRDQLRKLDARDQEPVEYPRADPDRERFGNE